MGLGIGMGIIFLVVWMLRMEICENGMEIDATE